MPPKRKMKSEVDDAPPKDPSATQSKRQRRVMTLSEKVEILDLLQDGESLASVGRYFGINESTVRSVKKREDIIRERVEVYACPDAKNAGVAQNKIIWKVEKVLNEWIVEQKQENATLNPALIREKAKALYEGFKAEEESEGKPAPEFKASKGWYEKFKRRYNLDGATPASTPLKTRRLTPRALEEIMQLQTALLDRVMELDKCPERRSKFKRDLEAACLPYAEMQGNLPKKLRQSAKLPVSTLFKGKRGKATKKSE